MRHLLPCILLIGCAHIAAPDHTVELTSAASAAHAPLPHDFRVVTFNLHGESGAVVAHALATDPELRNADLIVLEEVHGHNGCSTACEVARSFGYHAAFEPEFIDRDGTDGVAIVSRAPIESTSVIELPYINVHMNDEHRKAALVATLRIAGMPVTVYAVHLTNRLTVKQRARQMMPVLDDAQRRATPVIIAGDFNTSPFTWIAAVIPVPTGTQDDKFEALLRAHGFATPLHHSGPTSRWLGMKLDGIYTRGFQTKRFATTHASDVSDHLALWADMSAK